MTTGERRQRRRRVLVLTHQRYEHREDISDVPDKEFAGWKTEHDVIEALHALGHETRVVGGATDISEVRHVLEEWKPHIVFNLLEEFGGTGVYVPYLLGWLELMGMPFTGCNPVGLQLADSKQLMKKVLRYHRIPSPDFALFPRGRVVRRPPRLQLPLIVKSAVAHGSVGISQASVVATDEKLAERVEFVHERLNTDALAEEYIEGRELYVGLLGNQRLESFPIWELTFANLAEGAPAIATEKVKWDLAYQKRLGVRTGPARALPAGVAERMVRLGKRVYRTLGLSGYARMDFRLTEAGDLFLLEPNPNPDLALDEDFALSAKAGGMAYEQLIHRVLAVGAGYRASAVTS